MGIVTTGVISNLVANGLWSICTVMGAKWKDVKVRKKELKRFLERDVSAKVILQRATTRAAKGDTEITKQMAVFLASPDVEAIIRQMYSTQLNRKTIHRNLNDAFREFKECLQLYVGSRKGNVEVLAKQLFEDLCSCCERALEIALDKGILSAHELKSVARHKIVLDEIAAIKKNIKLLTTVESAGFARIHEFEEKYRQEVGVRHSYITPPHFDSARKVRIGRLYVEPEVVRLATKKGDEDTSLEIEDFLGEAYRVVILGNPGSGKSTLTFKICRDLATGYSKRSLGGRRVTPVLVTLREYGAAKKERSCSILEFVEEKANSTYQCKAVHGAFEYMFLNGRVVVIFDGLDELLDTSYRQQISGDIESFCRVYPSVPVIVTSRKVGYEQAPLDSEVFRVYWISEFDEGRVTRYVANWFALEEDFTEAGKKEKVQAFLRESSIVPDLRGNPLMLALMCSIYRGEAYIPRNRPDLYEKCAVMLFERWDKTRGIQVTLPFEAHIRPAIMYLANWIYSDEKLQGGVREVDLVMKATEYLCPVRFEDRDEAEKAAHEFVEFCRGRAWVFTDTGTEKGGERLYQFTHRTFMEYFSAAHIVRTHSTPEKLGSLLFPRVAKREWDVVAQLACQLLNKNVEGAGDELLSGLIAEAENNEGARVIGLTSFAGRCLQFLVPSPRVARLISGTCLDTYLSFLLHQCDRDPIPTPLGQQAQDLLGGLLSAAHENRVPIKKKIEEVLVERIMGDNEELAILAAEIGLDLPLPLWLAPRTSQPNNETVEFWRRVSDDLQETCREKLIQLGRKSIPVAFNCWRRGEIHAIDLVESHGPHALFRSHRYRAYPSVWTGVPAMWLIYGILSPLGNQQRLTRLVSCLTELGNILLSYTPPWVRLQRDETSFWHNLSEFIERLHRTSKTDVKLNPDAMFSCFSLVAVMLEQARNVSEIRTVLGEVKVKPVKDMSPAWLARFEQVQRDSIQVVLADCRFRKDQLKFIWQWIDREISLVAKKKEGASEK